MVDKNIIKKQTILIALLLLSFNLINAFGVASFYSNNNPLKLYSGEIKEIDIILNSAPSEENSVIKVDMTENGGIAELIDKNLEYNLNSGGEIPIKLRISVPSDSEIGKEYALAIKFSDVTPSVSGGMAPIKGISNFNFKVLVVEKPVETPAPAPAATEGISLTWWILGIIAVIAIIIVIWFVVKNKEN